MYAEAISEFQKSIPATGGDWSLSIGGLGYAYGLTGRQAEARKLIDKLKQLSTREYVPGNSIALIYIGLGDKNEAFEWLEKAYEQHAFQMQWLDQSQEWTACNQTCGLLISNGGSAFLSKRLSSRPGLGTINGICFSSVGVDLLTRCPPDQITLRVSVRVRGL